MIYDLLIVGGGIAGLYTAYEYQKRHPTHTILILERNRQIGGRIDTYHDTNYRNGIEAGAGRFHKKQILLMDLLRELDLEKNAVPISNFNTYYPIETKIPEPIDTNAIKNVIYHSRTTPIETLQNTIFIDYAKTVLTPEQIKALIGSFGYSSELTDMNAYDTIQLIKDHFNPNNQFYSLKGGLYQVIQSLHSHLKRKNVKIIIHRRVVNTNYIENIRIFETTCENIQKKYYSKICVYANTKETIQKIPIFTSIKSILEKIHTLPLCRIYSKFSPPNNQWFQNLPKITTNNNLRIVIPIDETTIMISYTDNHYARFWRDLNDKRGIDVVNRELQRLIHQTLGINIPKPEHTQIFYWEHAVAYFGKGFDSKKDTKKILCPFKNIPLYICGENFSEKNNQWMEGSLDTSKYILQKMD